MAGGEEGGDFAFMRSKGGGYRLLGMAVGEFTEVEGSRRRLVGRYNGTIEGSNKLFEVSNLKSILLKGIKIKEL